MTTPAPPAPVRATPTRRSLPPTGPRRSAPSPGTQPPWVTGIASGVAVLLAGSPVSAIVQSPAWFGAGVLAVAVVVATGLALHRFGVAVVTLAQCAAVVLLLTVRFAKDGFLLVLPGPAALREFGALISGASQQISTGFAPVAATPEILFLVTCAFGILTAGVYLAAVGAGAPAAAGVALLALFAVPAALADQLLPWWSVVGAAAGFGLLLVLRDGARRQLGGGAAVVAGAVAVALVIGAGTGFIGTSGRFNGTGSGQTGSAGSIGLSPFTALRGQLQQTAPVELFRVRGLKDPAYMRAITLADYLPDRGWQPRQRPEPGVALPGPTGNQSTGPLTDIQVENVAFRDYWMPLYGVPVEVGGVPAGQWAYDARSGIGYTRRARQEQGWAEKAYMGAPTAAELRGDNADTNPGPDYLNTTGVDKRVVDIANAAVGPAFTRFDKAVALQTFFTSPTSGFVYTLQTKPGGGDDALVEFLTTGKAGYCEQYASAMAVMLRTVGVPARVAVGFTGGKVEGDYRSITTSDAHAWVEAWFPEHGWITFDPTPLNDGRSITPPYVQEATPGAGGGSTPEEDETLPRNDQNDPGAGAEQPTPTPVDPSAAPTADQGGGLPLWPIGVVALLAIVTLVPFGVRTLERRRRLAATTAGGPAAATAAWDELLAESVDRGVPPKPSDTVRAAARRMVKDHHLEPPAQQALRDVVGAVEASWYGGGHPDAGSLDEPLQVVREGIATGTSLSMKQRLLPTSVISSLTRRLTGRKNNADEPDEDE